MAIDFTKYLPGKTNVATTKSNIDFSKYIKTPIKKDTTQLKKGEVSTFKLKPFLGGGEFNVKKGYPNEIVKSKEKSQSAIQNTLPGNERHHIFPAEQGGTSNAYNLVSIPGKLNQDLAVVQKIAMEDYRAGKISLPEARAAVLEARMKAEDEAKGISTNVKKNFIPALKETVGGFGKSIYKGIATPIAELGVSAYNVGKQIVGDDYELEKSRNVPTLGEVKPAFTGKETYGQGVKKMAGYGAEVASNFIGAEGGKVIYTGAKETGKQALKQAGKQILKEGVVPGLVGGGLYEGGSALKENKPLKEVAKSAIKGAIVGGAVGGALGTAGQAFKNIKTAQSIKRGDITPEIVIPEVKGQNVDEAIQQAIKKDIATPKIKPQEAITEVLPVKTTKLPTNKNIEQSVVQILDNKTGKVEFKTIKKGELPKFHNLIDDTKKGIAGTPIDDKVYHLTAKTPKQMSELGHTFTGEAKISDIPKLKEAKLPIKYIPEEKPVNLKNKITVEPVITAPKVSKRIEAQTIEKGLVDTFKDIPEIPKVNFKDEALRVKQIIEEDPEKAVRIALGKEMPTNGALPESVLIGVKNQALADNNTDLLVRLATEESGVARGSTVLGQRIKALDERLEDDAFKNIRDVIKNREINLEKKTGKKLSELHNQEVSKIKSEITKVKPTKDAWLSFVDELTC